MRDVIFIKSIRNAIKNGLQESRTVQAHEWLLVSAMRLRLRGDHLPRFTLVTNFDVTKQALSPNSGV